MPKFKVIACKETGSKKFYAVKAEIETTQSGKLEVQMVHCCICEACELSSGQTHWSIVSVEPEDLQEDAGDALLEKALENEIVAAIRGEDRSR